MPSWDRKMAEQEKEFQRIQEINGEYESMNNLNGGISRHLGLGDGRPGIEWTGAGLEFDPDRRLRAGEWPWWVWAILFTLLAIGLWGYAVNNPANPGAAGSSQQQVQQQGGSGSGNSPPGP